MDGCFIGTGDGTIHDTCTGLQWEKKDGTVGVFVNAPDLHDVNNGYPWAGCCGGTCAADGSNYCQPNAAAAATCTAQSAGGTLGCSMCASGTCNVDPGSAGGTVWDWINQVNAANFAGHSDWRLPSESACNTCLNSSDSCSSCSAHELETILLSAYVCGTDPCIASIFGPTASGVYWSSATYAPSPMPDPLAAWGVYFGVGAVGGYDKAVADYVRAVRGGS